MNIILLIFGIIFFLASTIALSILTFYAFNNDKSLGEKIGFTIGAVISLIIFSIVIVRINKNEIIDVNKKATINKNKIIDVNKKVNAIIVDIEYGDIAEDAVPVPYGRKMFQDNNDLDANQDWYNDAGEKYFTGTEAEQAKYYNEDGILKNPRNIPAGHRL